MKVTIVALALIAGLACVQAAGGIKGRQQPEETQQRFQAVKGPRQQQQQYLPPPPPPQPIALPLPVAQPQQAIKAGPGAVAPVFSAVRVQPAPFPVPAPVPIQQIQQVQQIQQIQEQVQEPEIVQQQQQPAQIQEEIDPNAAAQDSAPAVIAPARQGPGAAPAASEEEANPRPEPYSFQYAFDSGDSATSGSSTREESQDASGRVTGFYTLKGEDGRDRRVDYVADASGFRAIVRSNEMGTADKDSADVDWQVQAPSEGQLRAAESATQAARQRALLSPQPQQPLASASSQSQQKFSSPRQRGAAASNQQLSKTNPQQQQQQQQQQVQISQQLQEPFEQIRQTELSTRARKSRHAPFYLYTV